ncbi:cell division control protein 12 [Trichomonascus vanleenenianus]|uniref:septin family protein n=1 Tax=Trichomonascus vanleenenianus TaxID=2268995 RepID=UPI003ECA8C29
MVAGESGLGKTTFINTLFGDKFKDTAGSRKLFKQFGDEPIGYFEKTTKIDIKEAVYEENGFEVNFTVIDTPGFGDYTNNNYSWVPIANYIDEQHRMYMLREEQPDRSEIIDTRVHACLYFIRPSGHGLLPLDIKVMQELSGRVNLIPVLAKADSFTIEGRERFKSSVRAAIRENNISVYYPSLYGDGIHDDTDSMPFAIISSESMTKTPSGKLVRGRKYGWGIAEVDNEDHCDFQKLRRVLMSNYMLDLMDSTVEKHYEKYRRTMMATRIQYAKVAAAQDATTQNGSDQRDEGRQLIVVNGNIHDQMFDERNILGILRAVSKYGKDFLQNENLESDPIFYEKQLRVQERFNKIVEFQEKKFHQWRTELKSRQDCYNAELEQAHQDVLKLQLEIEQLEQAASHRRFDHDGLEKLSGRSNRYTIRRNALGHA